MRSLRRGSPALALLAALALGGCGGADDQATTEEDVSSGGGAVADTSVCRADASPVATPYPGDFPTDWPFPDGTVVHGVEDRGSGGTIVTGIVTADFHDVLDFMNGDVVDAGYAVDQGETEEDDAEAEWSGNGYRGRWAIRESPTCDGETVIQVVAARGEE